MLGSYLISFHWLFQEDTSILILQEENLQENLKQFPANQLLVLRSEAFFADPAGVTEQVWRFLGVKPKPQQHQRASNRGLGEASQVPPSTRAWLEQQLQEERAVMEEWLARLGPHAQPT